MITAGLAGEIAGPILFGAGHEDLAVGAVNALEERNKGGTAAGIELAHDVVDEQDGRGAEVHGEILGLGEFQGDGDGTFLAFAGELSSGFGIERQEDFVAVRADHGGFEDALAVAGLFEFAGEIGADAGLIIEAEFFGGVGDALVGFEDERGDERKNGFAAAGELFADGDEFFGEAFEGVSVGRALFEEGVAGAKGFRVALEKREIGGLGLGEDEIDETAASAGGAFDEEDVVGTENDGAEDADEIGEFADGLGIDGELALALGPVDFDFVAGLGKDFGADEVAGLVVADHLGAADAAEGTEGGEEVNGFEDIGFALGVVAEEKMEAGSELEIEARVIAEVAQA